MTGSNAVTQFDKGFNVKFRANKLRNRLALDGQVPTFANIGQYEESNPVIPAVRAEFVHIRLLGRGYRLPKPINADT